MAACGLSPGLVIDRINGATLSSGYTERLSKHTLSCGIRAQKDNSNCCRLPSGSTGQTVPPESIYLQSKTCLPPTPAQFALYPKVAVPESVRIQTIVAGVQYATLPEPSQRFNKYDRYQVRPPCLPLSQASAAAGISQPSSRDCNLMPRNTR